MLHRPEVTKIMRDEVVPVTINCTYDGIPNIPAIAHWQESFKRNVWTQMIFAHFVLLDPSGERIYGASTCQYHEIAELSSPFHLADVHLRQLIGRYHTAKRLEKQAATDPVAKATLEALYAAIDKEVKERRTCLDDDRRLITARFLLGFGAEAWKIVESRLLPPAPGGNDKLMPGMRIAALHNLANFVWDETPFAPASAEHLRITWSSVSAAERDRALAAAVARAGADGRKDLEPRDFTMPESLKRLAAAAVTKIAKLSWSADDPDVVAKVKTWWNVHRNDPDLAIPDDYAKGN